MRLHGHTTLQTEGEVFREPEKALSWISEVQGLTLSALVIWKWLIPARSTVDMQTSNF